MSSVATPKGPLPPRVYWTRRLVALALTFALVFGISRLLSDGGQGSDSPSARPAAAPAASPSSGRTPSASALPAGNAEGKPGKDKKEGGDKAKATKTPLAVPTGPCEATDVSVVPSVDDPAYAGRPVTITLNLSTLESPACTWEVSPDSVVVKLTSGADRIWTTQDCEEAIPAESVVVRKDQETKVDVAWSTLRSDEECTRFTSWAQPGYYHATAAAYGAEPKDIQFQLLRPVAETITPEPDPEPKRKQSRPEDRSQTRKRDR